MNKQEAIEKIEKEKSNLNAWEDLTRNRALDDALAIVRKLDEPEKPVVPQFVADWLEVCKENLGFSLSSAMSHSTSVMKAQPNEVQGWFNLRDNQETFAKAWLFGYEVEKEKLYTVKFSNEDFGKIYIGIFKKFNKLGISSLPLNDDEVKSWFTEDELKRFKFWDNPAFEIKEVGE